jgi:anti-sigma factor RsiW
MPNCRDVEPLFAPYVDGEAAPDQRASVRAHIDCCPPCRDNVAVQRAAREVLVARRDGLRASASARLRARCAAQCPAGARTGSGWAALPGWRALVPLSLAATLLLAIGGAFLYSAVDQVDALAAQLALDHMKCAKIESARVDAAAAGAQWASNNGWRLTVPPSAPDRQLEFLRVRRCLVTDGRTAHLMYKWRGEPLSVFVLPTQVDALGTEQIVATFGHEAIMWSSGGRTYIVLARGRPDEMAPLVTYVRANAQ